MVVKEAGDGVLVFGETFLVLGDTGLFPAATALAEILEKQTGHIGVTLGIGRPAREYLFGAYRPTGIAGSAQLGEQLSLDTSCRHEAGLFCAGIPISFGGRCFPRCVNTLAHTWPPFHRFIDQTCA
jgi:hypothetical protein